jgi:branched-chain amino acid transport system ATP-binding protein
MLDISGLAVRYGKLEAVNGVDLHVDAGEVVAVLGSNGAGKSSTLNAIVGSVRASAGTVKLDGEDITKMPSHRTAGRGLVLVPEGRHIISPLTVADNLLLGGYTVKSKTARTESLARVYDIFPVLHKRRSSPGGVLSGGEQQMLAFGRAMMSNPRVLLLDEPSMGLSPAMTETVMDAIARIAQLGPSILMVEQNATSALALATRVYVMEQGDIILEGPAETIMQDPLVLRAFLGIEDEPDIPVDELI